MCLIYLPFPSVWFSVVSSYDSLIVDPVVKGHLGMNQP